MDKTVISPAPISNTADFVDALTKPQIANAADYVDALTRPRTHDTVVRKMITGRRMRDKFVGEVLVVEVDRTLR